MELDINEIIAPYKEFFGPITLTMPKLIAEGRIPLSVADIMERRLNSKKQDWKYNDFTTGDAFAYHPDGRFKVVRDARLLRKLTPSSRLRDGMLALNERVYESLPGIEFKRKRVILGRKLSAEEARNHPIWRIFARDNALLDAYVDSLFSEMKRRFGYDATMSICLPDVKIKPTMGAAHIAMFNDTPWNSSSLGDERDYSSGSLVGAAPWVPRFNYTGGLRK